MNATVFIPIARGRMLTLAILWAVPALILGVAVFTIYPNLHFRPTGVSSRIVDFSIAVATLPLIGLGMFSTLRAVLYFLAALWPGKLGLYADREYLQLFLGPFGRKGFRVAELAIRYPFEREDDEGGGFEQFLPEEEQKSRLLPRIIHPSEKTPINRIILHFVAGNEDRIVNALSAVILQWRGGC